MSEKYENYLPSKLLEDCRELADKAKRKSNSSHTLSNRITSVRRRLKKAAREGYTSLTVSDCYYHRDAIADEFEKHGFVVKVVESATHLRCEITISWGEGSRRVPMDRPALMFKPV